MFKNANAQRLFWISVLSSAILGCSNSSQISNFEDPRKIEEVDVSFVIEKTLFEYSPASDSVEEDTPVLRRLTPESSEVDFFVQLDSDAYEQSIAKNGDEFISFRTKDIGPDFFVYSQDNTVYSYNLSTRRTEELIAFGRLTNPNGLEIICDIQALLIFDSSDSTTDTGFLRHDRAFTVKAMPFVGNSGSLDNCSLATDTDFRYYKVNIVDTEDTYEIEREQEPDELTGEVDTVSETVPVLEGQKVLVSEVLMYGGRPIFNEQASQFGYLGYDSRSRQLEFWSLSIDSTELALATWELPLNRLSFVEMNNARSALLNSQKQDPLRANTLAFESFFLRSPDDNREFVHTVLEGNIITTQRDALFSPNLGLDINDDINTPIYTYIENAPIDADLIVDNRCMGANQITSFEDIDAFDFEGFDYGLLTGSGTNGNRVLCIIDSNGAAENVDTNVSAENTSDEIISKASLRSSSVFIEKTFQNSGTEIVDGVLLGPKSYVSKERTIGIEQSKISRSDGILVDSTNTLYTNHFDTSSGSLVSTNHNLSAQGETNTVAVDYIEMRQFPGQESKPTNETIVFRGDRSIQLSATEFALEASTAICTNSGTTLFYGCPENTDIATFPFSIVAAETNQVVALKDNYGLARLKYAETMSTGTSIYTGLFYYDPHDTTDFAAHIAKPMELICILEDANGERFDSQDERSCYYEERALETL